MGDDEVKLSKLNEMMNRDLHEAKARVLHEVLGRDLTEDEFNELHDAPVLMVYRKIMDNVLHSKRSEGNQNDFDNLDANCMDVTIADQEGSCDLPESIDSNASASILDPVYMGQISKVLTAYFSNGYRLNSIIELKRFRNFAAMHVEDEITMVDSELNRCIIACGITFDGKVYAVSNEIKKRIKDLVEAYFADGASAIFYDEFYKKNERWLIKGSVVSETMLIDILRSLFPEHIFTRRYWGFTNSSVNTVVEGEILRVWGDQVLQTYNQLAERLFYIPLSRIRNVLGQNGDFFKARLETFSHISQVDITEKEKQSIRDAAQRECNVSGYLLATNLPMYEIEERNYELTNNAIEKAIFRICLSDEFDRKGKIIIRKGDSFEILTIIKDHCRLLEKCSLNDLLNFMKEFTGGDSYRIVLEAANSVMIRIGKNAYVADRHVQFEPERIDKAIELFIKGEYLPLQSVTTFGAFPDCGQKWNLFVLESYCRRFSYKFRFNALTGNSRNAGTIIRKNCMKDYMDILVDAITNANVALEASIVADFLSINGFTGRKLSEKKIMEIIHMVKAN